MWSCLLTFFSEWKWKLCFKETKCKICWICQCADKCEAASSEFSRHKCDRGTLVTLSPCPTSTFIIDWFPFPPILWSSQLDCEDCGLDSNCKRSGSSSISISSDLAWRHTSIGAVRGLLSFRLISGVTCLSDLHRPIRDQEQELILGRGKVVSG